MVLGTMRAVGIFPTHDAAELAKNALVQAGFAPKKVSIVVKDTSPRADQLSNADISDPVAEQAEGGAKRWAIPGALLGSLSGLLVGLDILALPGMHPMSTPGTIEAAVFSAFVGAALGAIVGSMAGAYTGIEMHNQQLCIYDERISQGDHVVMLEGTTEEIERAEKILREREAR